LSRDDILLKDLLGLGWLTGFQCDRISEGKIEDLVVGSYVLLEPVENTGSRQVFKARPRTGRNVVTLKTSPPEDSNAAERLRKEIQAVAQLAHPNIAACLDSGDTGGRPFLVMETVDGESLSKLVERQGPLQVTQALGLILEVARGMEYAHDHRLLHRDLKPVNLVLDGKGTLKILDLGSVRQVRKVLNSTPSLTETDVLVGTPAFMAPEQALNYKKADRRADIYSLGCVLHFLLTGHPPYAGQTPADILLAHRDEAIPDLTIGANPVSPGVQALLARLLPKSPEKRPATMREVAECREKLPAEKPDQRAAAPPAAESSPAADQPEIRIVADQAQEASPEKKPASRPSLVPKWAWWTTGAAAAGILVLVVVLLSSSSNSATDKNGAGDNARQEGQEDKTPLPVSAAATASSWEVKHILRGHDAPITAAVIDPKGARLATAGNDGRIRIWNLASGLLLKELKGHKSPVNCLAFDPNSGG